MQRVAISVSGQSPPDRGKGTVRNFEVVYYVVCSIDQIRDMGSTVTGVNVSFLKAPNTYKNGYLDHIRLLRVT